MKGSERTDLLAQVAVWYFEERLDQATIARRIGKSRSMVSRMLNEVRDLGMVEIKIKYPMRRATYAEAALAERFPSVTPFVLDGVEQWGADMRARMVGRLAVAALQRHLRDGVRIGVAWSRSLHSLALEMPQQALRDAMVVQISGSVFTDNPVFDGPELVRTIAQRLNAEYRYFPAPLVVRDGRLKNDLMAEGAIADALRLAESVDVAIVGVGNVHSDDASLRLSGLVDAATMRELRNHNATGDILARQFDEDGTLLALDFNQCIVGLEPHHLRSIPAVIAVAYGAAKARAILAALRGGWFSALVTDSVTAEGILRIGDETAQMEAG